MSGSWRFASRLARRDLSRSLRGLRLLFLCIFLGVTTITAIGSLTAAITGELEERGQLILGGDVQVAMNQRTASEAEAAAMRSAGAVSETIRMRAMARRPATGAAVLSELKGVDSAYPLYGSLLVGARPAPELGPTDIFIAAELGERLQVALGDRIRFGEADFRIAGIISNEPDRVGEGFTLGPPALVTMTGLERTGLVQPGSLFTTKYRLRLPPGADPEQIIERLRSDFPDSSWEFRDRDGAAPGTSRFFDRMGQFLTLVGLAAMVIAGIGVNGGVGSYLTSKQGSIATLKMLGAQSGDISRIFFIQIGVVTVLAVLAGLALGAVLPVAVIAIAGDLLPVTPGIRLYPVPLAVSATYGLLMALIFALPPLGRARMQPVASLFRNAVTRRDRPDARTLIAVAVAGAAVVALAVGTSDNRLFAASVLGAVAAVLLLLALLGWAIRRLARAVPRPRRPLLRLAVTGLYRPGAQTVGLVVALGLALTLFVTLAAVQTSLSAEIERTVPQQAPDLFVLDIPAERRDAFQTLVGKAAPTASVNIVPTLRGTITRVGGAEPTAEQRRDQRFLFGERGVTYSATLPGGSMIMEGEWWPVDYRGPPLVSLDAEAAEELKLKVGDTLTVSVLGREINARIASLRKIKWETMGFNYILVFPPSTLASAPHNLAATVMTAEPGQQQAVTRAVLAALPSASVVDVREIIQQVSTILGQMMTAILIAASVAVLAGIAVLIGALAAARQARSYDSVILKLLGATRGQVLAAQALEYAVLAAVVAAVSLALGLGGGWFVIVQVFEFGWAPDWPVILATLFGGATLTLAIAILGSLPLLSVRAASALRQL